MMTAEPAEIILCDVMMPVHDGIWLAEQVRSRWPQTAVIMASSAQDMETVMRMRKQGAVDYVTKPFGREMLRQALTASHVKRCRAPEFDADLPSLTRRSAHLAYRNRVPTSSRPALTDRLCGAVSRARARDRRRWRDGRCAATRFTVLAASPCRLRRFGSAGAMSPPASVSRHREHESALRPAAAVSATIRPCPGWFPAMRPSCSASAIACSERSDAFFGSCVDIDYVAPPASWEQEQRHNRVSRIKYPR